MKMKKDNFQFGPCLFRLGYMLINVKEYSKYLEKNKKELKKKRKTRLHNCIVKLIQSKDTEQLADTIVSASNDIYGDQIKELASFARTKR